MCLNLIGSQYNSISEIETLLESNYLNLTEKDIINMKNNRNEIDKQLRLNEQFIEIDILYS